MDDAKLILKRTAATLDVRFADDADGDVSVAVVDEAGDAVAAGAATADPDTAGRYTFDLPPQTQLARLTVDWTGEFGGVEETLTGYVEVVGAQLFTVGELRAFGDGALADAAQYPDADLEAKRDEIAAFFEQECGISFVPRYARELLDGDGGATLYVRRRRPTLLRSVVVDGVALTADEIENVFLYSSRALVRRYACWPCGLQNVVVEYVHGHQAPPRPIKEAALLYARYKLVTTELDDRTVTVANDLGTVRLSVPGDRYPTGIPVVDATICRYSTLRLA